MVIKWVCFDLDDTLFNGTLLVDKARRASIQMMIQYGLPIDEEYALKVLEEIVFEFGSNSESHLDNLLIRLQNDPATRLDPKLNFNKFVAAGVMGYHREKVKHFKLFKDVTKAIEDLRKIGVQTAIITDGSPKKQYEKILRLKLENSVDEILISDEVAARKPNTFLFRLFLNNHHLSPKEVIYIGDRIDRDIEPAQKTGIIAILVHRGTKWDPNLTKEKIPVRPDFHINSLHEIFKIIESLNKSEEITNGSK